MRPTLDGAPLKGNHRERLSRPRDKGLARALEPSPGV
jgi:hypothetical protein